MSKSGNLCKVAMFSTVALIALLVPVAAADLTNVVLRVEAQTGRSGWGYIEITQDDGWWDGDTFYWESDRPMEIRDQSSGQLLGTFGGGATSLSYTLPANARTNPQVNLGFAMQAGSSTTTFQVKSALMTFGPYVNPQGRASVAINVSDFGDADGATLVGACPAGGSYVAQYNGFVPAGATFSEAINSIYAAPYDTAGDSNDTGWQPIAGTVGDMSTMIRFTLTANDFASGTSSFQITPEPSALLLLVVGLVVARRR